MTMAHHVVVYHLNKDAVPHMYEFYVYEDDVDANVNDYMTRFKNGSAAVYVNGEHYGNWIGVTSWPEGGMK